MIGLRFDAGPLGFPGFCNSTSISWFIFFGQSPSDPILLKISAILSLTQSGAYIINSTGISSHPGDLFIFIFDTAFLISSDVNGLDITIGRRSEIGSASFQNMSLKYLAMIFVCVSQFVGSSLSDFITKGYFGLIFLMFLTASYIL